MIIHSPIARAFFALSAFATLSSTLAAQEVQLWQAPIIDIANESNRKVMLRVTYERPDLIPTDVEIFPGARAMIRAKTFQRISTITLDGRIVSPWQRETRYNYRIREAGGFDVEESRIQESGIRAIWREMDDLNRSRPPHPEPALAWAAELEFWAQEGVRSILITGGRVLYSN